MSKKVAAIVDVFWGDNGKGMLADYISPNYDIVCRPTSGSNSGHQIVINREKHTARLIPSGIFNPNIKAVLGNGMVICPFTLAEEINGLIKSGFSRADILDQIIVSDNASIVMPYHKFVDSYLSSSKAIGTTKNGIGMAYADKVSRVGIRFSDFFDLVVLKEKMAIAIKNWANVLGSNKDFLGDDFDIDKILDNLKPILIDLLPLVENTEYYLNNAYNNGKDILLEGSQGHQLSLNFGTYPFVTSCDCSIGGMVSGSGLSANKINSVIGVLKGYITRVGAGPFPTKLEGTTAEFLQKSGNEFGSVTGRPRDVGWLDLELLKQAVMINGITEIALTKLDVMLGLPEIKICSNYKFLGSTSTYEYSFLRDLYKVKPQYKTLPGWSEDITQVRSFEDLPQNTKDYIKFIEDSVEVPVRIISVGADREATFTK